MGNKAVVDLDALGKICSFDYVRPGGIGYIWCLIPFWKENYWSEIVSVWLLSGLSWIGRQSYWCRNVRVVSSAYWDAPPQSSENTRSPIQVSNTKISVDQARDREVCANTVSFSLHHPHNDLSLFERNFRPFQQMNQLPPGLIELIVTC